jgi:hypothetical protein
VISETELAHWRTVVPWLDRSQVEQDLVLSRLIVVTVPGQPTFGGVPDRHFWDGGRWDGLPPLPTVEEDVYATAVEHADLSLEDPDF